MPPLEITVEMVDGIFPSKDRAVAFLCGHEELTAVSEFKKVSNIQLGKKLRHKMTLWIAEVPDKAGKFHRFKNEDRTYRECFTFEDLDAQVRIYGFTCHPKIDRSFELVLLVRWVQKKTHHTDYAELNRVLYWKDQIVTQAALRYVFQDTKGVQ